MKVTTEERPQQEALLSIELEPDDVETYLERAYRKTVKRLNVPGFRKGKAPRRIIEQMYGREYLLNEALDFMVPEATNKAVEESSLEVAGVPSIKLEQLDPPSFTATIPSHAQGRPGQLSLSAHSEGAHPHLKRAGGPGGGAAPHRRGPLGACGRACGL